MGSNPIGRADTNVIIWDIYLNNHYAGVAVLVVKPRYADVAQLVEHATGNGEVSGSIPDIGSRNS